MAHFKHFLKVYILFGLLFGGAINTLSAMENDSSLKRYNNSYDSLQSLLNIDGSFKKAVFITESAFKEILSEESYNEYINGLKKIVLWNKARFRLKNYRADDSTNYLNNLAIFSTICDTTSIDYGHYKGKFVPYKYNLEDPNGKLSWTNIFVSQLFTSRSGNCRSFTYLYKILADELETKAWLALAPNHIYIRNFSSKLGWYNTELSSGNFPTDAWIAASGYVSADAIRSGIYMDTLSNRQSIALCLVDLAKGYELQTRNYYDGFILKCCELALKYHPTNPMALLLRAETLKKIYFKQERERDSLAAATYTEMKNAYILLAKLHYREMPEKMYQQWLTSLMNERNKYANKKMQPNTKAPKTTLRRQ